jgi:hypothetical protein
VTSPMIRPSRTPDASRSTLDVSHPPPRRKPSDHSQLREQPASAFLAGVAAAQSVDTAALA